MEIRFDEIGFAVDTPAGWHLQPMEWVIHNRKEMFGEYVVSKTTLPLVAGTKYPEPYPTLNTSLQIVYRPSPDAEMSALDVMELVSPHITQVLGAPPSDDIQSMQVDGKEAAGVAGEYRLEANLGDGPVHFDVAYFFCVVPRGENLLMFSIVGPSDEKDNAADFQRMLDSVELS